MPAYKINIRFPQFEAVENNPCGDWKLDDGRTIVLLTAPQLRSLKQHAPKAMLISIFGESVEAQFCDEDIRFGYVAFGQIKGALS